MKIGQVSRRAGASVDTLRFYERIGLIRATARDPDARRDLLEAHRATVLARIAEMRAAVKMHDGKIAGDGLPQTDGAPDRPDRLPRRRT